VDNQGNVFTTGFESDGFYDGEFITLKSFVRRLAMGDALQRLNQLIDMRPPLSLIATGNSYITGWSGGAK